jgi:hypothetical protein
MAVSEAVHCLRKRSLVCIPVSQLPVLPPSPRHHQPIVCNVEHGRFHPQIKISGERVLMCLLQEGGRAFRGSLLSSCSTKLTSNGVMEYLCNFKINFHIEKWQKLARKGIKWIILLCSILGAAEQFSSPQGRHARKGFDFGLSATRLAQKDCRPYLRLSDRTRSGH